MDCGICLEPIVLFYYKGKCDCNVRYHYGCIISWYKYKKICILCNKEDNINPQLLEYRYNKLLTTTLILFIFFFFFQYYVFINMMNE